MKKVLATILAFIYLSTSMGATVHLHYCMGKLMSWGLLDKENKSCTFCGMAKTGNDEKCLSSGMGCCKDEQKLIQTDKDQKVTQSEVQLIKIFPDAIAANHLDHTNLRIFSSTIEYPIANAPPKIGKVPVFLLNRNFRI
jgi:hypothetical protein